MTGDDDATPGLIALGGFGPVVMAFAAMAAPIAKLTPYTPPAQKRRFGRLKGKISIGPEFFEPLPDEELAA